MPSNSKKILYLGTCMEDLHKLGDVDILRTADPEKHLVTAEKAFTKAEELWIEGDEEKSFVLFMRYINSVEKCKKTLLFAKKPAKYNPLISKKLFVTSIERCEILKDSLQKRYKERKQAEDQLMEQPLPPKSTPKELMGPFITPGEVYSLLSSKPPLAVVVDCRGVEDRNQGIIINLPIIYLSTDVPILSTSLSGVKRELSRMKLSLTSVLLVLMDSDSQELTAGLDRPVLELRDSLHKFDTDGELKEAPRIMDGGFESWRLHYPAYSDTSNTRPAVSEVPVDDVIFPSIDSPPPRPRDDFFTPRRDPPQVPTNGESANQIPESWLSTQQDVMGDDQSDSVSDSVLDPIIDTAPVIETTPITHIVPVVHTPIIPPKPPHLSAEPVTPSAPIIDTDPVVNTYLPIIPPKPQVVLSAPEPTNQIPSSLEPPNPRMAYGPIPDPPSYETSMCLPPAVTPSLPLPPPVSCPIPNPVLSSLPVRIPDNSFLVADTAVSLPPVTREMERELEEKEMRMRALESELAKKEVLEEKLRALEQQSGVEARDIELQKQRMLEEIANEKQRADQELVAKQKQLMAMEQQAKQQLRQEMESIKIEKGHIQQEKSKLDLQKREVAERQVQLDKDISEFEKVKRSVLEQVKQAQQSQAANPSHHFAQEQTTLPPMQLNHGLPPGWRKLFDSSTGRFYYQDDSTKTTHWNPPTSWIVSQQPNIMQGKTKGALLSSFQPPEVSKSPSTPAISHVAASTPGFDRTTKPVASKTPEIPSRATKNPALANPYYPQILARIQAKSKSLSFDPSHGGTGQALTGLKNLGNTCFMNSILQCLSATYPLAEYFITFRFIQHVNPVNPLGMGGEIAEEFSFLVQALWKGSYKSIAPKDFKRVLSKFAPQFSGTQQHDSQEFLAFLLDGLHEDLNKVLKKEYIQEQDNHGVPDIKASQISWDNHLKRNDSIIVDLFQGQFKSTLTCLQCGFSSATFEAFMYLSVPIPGSADVTLMDCVRQFTKAEKVSGSNSWFCARCKTHRESAKQLEIWRLPPVLLIHLKRFSFHGKWKQKLETNVNFPLSGLNLAPITLGPLKPTPYQLFAVSNHSGTLERGHYTAYVRNAVNQKFYTFDDSVVQNMSTSNVMTKNGYMLFYTSVDFTPKLKL